MSLKLSLQFTSCLLLSFLYLSVAGCGSGEKLPPLGYVKGKVTLDGKPLPKADVMFQPTEAKIVGSFGTTDEAGNYELLLGGRKPGAGLGKHVVSVTTSGLKEDGSTPPELVPAKYFTEDGKLQFVVAAGQNTINIELKSK